MQIVIDIPKEVYHKLARKTDGFIHPLDERVIGQAICAGARLPEQHGDLKDANKIIKEIEEKYPFEDWREVICRLIAKAPTIIPATRKE